jgi:hypothetical protein
MVAGYQVQSLWSNRLGACVTGAAPDLGDAGAVHGAADAGEATDGGGGQDASAARAGGSSCAVVGRPFPGWAPAWLVVAIVRLRRLRRASKRC